MPAQKIRRWFITTLIAMVVLGVAAGTALSRARDAEADTVLGDRPTPTSAAGTEPVYASMEPLPSSDVPDQVTTRNVSKTRKTAETSRSAEAGHTSEAPAGPRVVTFQVEDEPSCPSGTDQARTEGRPVVLVWKVSGADKTTLSVDGPGIYGEYGIAGSVTLNFPCDGDPGTHQAHTYILTAVGPDGSKSKKLTVTAKVNEIATT